METLWLQADETILEEEALFNLFGAHARSLEVATNLYNWLKTLLPFRCGVRMGKDRISFLIGNYRPAAIKKHKGKVRLDMGFVNKLPEGFKKASEVWKSIPSAIEGYTVIESEENLTLLLNDADLIRNFTNACRQMLEVAPKSRRHLCNVLATWPEGK